MSLVVQDLRKTYTKPFSRTPPFEAVKGVSFEIGSGEIYALLGPNGAGKSTIIKTIAGLIEPTAGKVLLNGVALSGDSIAYKKVSAVLEGTRNIYWRLTPLENLFYFANLRGKSSTEVRDRALELLHSFDIEGKQKNQSQHLSRGMLQKLAFAAALITDPEILLLDEPTLGLDVGSGRKIKEIILDLARNHKKTILLTTHQMDLVEEVADRVGILREGKLAREGSLIELRSVFETFLYRIRIRGEVDFSDEMNTQYAIRPLHSHPEYTEFEADCRDANGIYGLIERLNRDRHELLSVQKATDDLEEIFLRTLS